MPPIPIHPGYYFLNTVIFGFIVFLLQKAVSNRSDRALADFKGDIDRQLLSYKNLYDQELLGYKISFDKELEEHKSQLKNFTDKVLSLHTERIKIIRELYEKLVRLDSAMRSMTRTMIPIYQDAEKEEQARVDATREAYAEFNNFVLYNRIYFSKELAGKLESIVKEYWSAQWDWFEPKRFQSMGIPIKETYKSTMDKVRAASQKVQDEIPKIIIEIEDEFRKILNVE
jgi:hypothetical protein